MDIKTLKEYLNIHLISLEQDLEGSPDTMDWYHITGQVNTVKHILSLINE